MSNTSIKETFIIRTEWYDAISELSSEDRLIFFDNLFHYHRGDYNLINLNNLTVKLVWKLIEPDLARNIEKFDRRCETSARNGAKGGRPRKETKPKQNLDKPKKPSGLKDKPNNPEYEHEHEHDSEYEHEYDIPPFIPPKGYESFNFSFLDPIFEKCLVRWLEYKKTKNQKYKSSESLEIMYKKMVREAGGDPEVAMAMIDESMSNNWAGLFKVKTTNDENGNNKISRSGSNPNRETANDKRASRQSLDQLADGILEQYKA